MSYVIKDSIQGNSFIKSGGTSAQYLMADGSITTGVTDTNALHKTGDESFTGTKSSTIGGNAALYLTNNGPSYGIYAINSGNGQAMYVDNNSTSTTGIHVNNTSTGTGFRAENSSTGFGSFINNTNVGTGLRIDNTVNGAGMEINNYLNSIGLITNNLALGEGIRATNNSTGKGITVYNQSSGKGLYVDNNNTGDAITSNAQPTASGYNYVGQNNFVNTFTVDILGNIVAKSFIKTGGLSNQFLMADGSVTTGGGGGGIGGSGTASFIPKFSSSTAITNSAIYDLGVNNVIGIGTTTPRNVSSYANLTIDGVPVLTLHLRINNTDGGGLRYDAAGLGVRTVTTTPVTFEVNSSERGRFATSGNFLIGTTSDGIDKLQVNGNVLSTAYKVNGGTSSQFLKGDGSLDSTTYANNSNVLHTTGTETKNGRLVINSPLNQGLVSTSPNAEGVLSMTDSAFSPAFIAQNNGGGDIANFNAIFGSVVAKIDYSGRVFSQAVTIDNNDTVTSLEINTTAGNGIISTNSATDNALFINTASAGLNSASVYSEVNSSSVINYCYQGSVNGTKGRILMGFTTSSLDEMIWLKNEGTGVHAPVIRSEHGKGEGVHIECGNTGESLVINHSAGASGNAFRYTRNGTDKATLQDNGRLFLNTPFEISNFHLVQMTTNNEHPGGIFVNDNTTFGNPNAPLFAGYVNNTDPDNPGLAFYAQMGNNNQGTGFRVDGNLSTRATPFIYNFGGFPKFIVTSAGTVSATSFAVNYGTNSQAQIADGSLITLSSATFTPVFANLSNITSSPTNANCSYTVVGKIVTGRINFVCTDTAANTPSQLTFTIPSGHVIVGTPSLGSGTKINGGTGANYSVLVYQNTSTTIRLYWYALSTGSSGVAAMFQYQIT